MTNKISTSDRKKTSLKGLTSQEQKNIRGGGSLEDFFNWLGNKASALIPCGEPTGINYQNYQDYVNPNDPLM